MTDSDGMDNGASAEPTGLPMNEASELSSPIPSADVRAAMAQYDAVIADCPANRYHLGEQRCPKCGALPSDDCWPSNRAADRFVAAMKEMLR